MRVLCLLVQMLLWMLTLVHVLVLLLLKGRGLEPSRHAKLSPLTVRTFYTPLHRRRCLNHAKNRDRSRCAHVAGSPVHWLRPVKRPAAGYLTVHICD